MDEQMENIEEVSTDTTPDYSEILAQILQVLEAQRKTLERLATITAQPGEKRQTFKEFVEGGE